MTLWLWVASALASPLVQVDGTLGMRAGVAGTVLQPVAQHVELGGRLQLDTEVYAGAPSWVTDGLDPRLNLHLQPQAVAGVHTGDTPVSLAWWVAAGPELIAFVEEKKIPTQSEPVRYGRFGVRPAGGTALDLRFRGKGRWGGHLATYVPLPLAPTGFLYVDRIHLSAGVTVRLGPNQGAS